MKSDATGIAEAVVDPAPRPGRTALIVAAVVTGIVFVVPATIFVAALAMIVIQLSISTPDRGLMEALVIAIFSLVPIGYGIWAWRYIRHREANLNEEPITGVTVFLTIILTVLITGSILIATCFGVLGLLTL